MISKKAEYAINILVALAKSKNNSYIPSRVIATQNNLPLNLVPQLVSLLQKKGLINSAKGPKGGISLAKPSENISIKEVIEIIDGPMGITTCLRKDNHCPNIKTCPLRKFWQKTQGTMLHELEKTTIKDLATEYKKAALTGRK